MSSLEKTSKKIGNLNDIKKESEFSLIEKWQKWL